MFHYQTKFTILLTIFMFYSTRAKNSNNSCRRSCGEHSLNYPFGFSSGCEIQLNCTKKQVQIGELQVQNVTSESIFISLPEKCNRNSSFIYPLFGNNFAPTWNNSFLVQNCSSNETGCVIPAAGLFGSSVEGCNSRSIDNISCFTPPKKNKTVTMMMTPDDWNKSKCKFLFSAFAVDRSKGFLLQFQVVELGWWLQGPGICSDNADSNQVSLGGGKQGFRCHCREGFFGDGFINGTGCHQRVSHCKASTLWSGGCRKAVKIGVLAGVIILGASLVAALLCYSTRRRSKWLRKQVK